MRADIKGYEDRYFVTDSGEVFSKERHAFGCENVSIKEKRKSITDNGNGYKIVTLTKNYKRKNYYVHRLVAELFIDNPNGHRYVNHIDGNKANNAKENLEWCTCSQNHRHAYKNNLRTSKNACSAMRNALEKPIVAMDGSGNDIPELVFKSAVDASDSFGLSSGAIQQAIHRKYKSVGYLWRYI